MAEAPGRHGLSLPLRTAVYRWFDRWLAGGKGDETITELPVEPRRAQDLLVTESGQVNVSLKSRPLLPLALEQFRELPSKAKRPLRDILLLDPESAEYRPTEIAPGNPGNRTLLVCVNGNESPNWREQKEFLAVLAEGGFATVAVDPRGVGSLARRVYESVVETTPIRSLELRRTWPTTHFSSANRCWVCGWLTS
jgi:pimeloyl-ACP methyl ester carboxylesterase